MDPNFASPMSLAWFVSIGQPTYTSPSVDEGWLPCSPSYTTTSHAPSLGSAPWSVAPASGAVLVAPVLDAPAVPADPPVVAALPALFTSLLSLPPEQPNAVIPTSTSIPPGLTVRKLKSLLT